MTENTRDFTNSELRTYSRCKRKWWLAYYRKLTPLRESTTGVRKLGTRIHIALAAYYSLKKVDLIEAFLATFDADDVSELYEDELAEREKDRELGVKMLEGYLQWVEEEGADVGLEVYAEEADLAVQLPIEHYIPGVVVRLRGRLDVRAHRELDGARAFVDHKSVGSFQQATATLAQDHQMLTYHLLELLDLKERDIDPDDERCDGGLYNMLRRVKRTGAAKPPFYAREMIHHNITQLRNHYVQTYGRITEILELEERLNEGGDHQRYCPPHVEASCTWSCDFFHACALFDDGSNVEGFLERYFVGYDPMERYVQSDGREEDRGDD